MDSKYRIFVIHLHLLVMAAYHSTPHFQSKRSVSSLLQSFLVFFLLLSFTEAISFHFANFESSPRDIHRLADAFFADGDIQLTQALISKPNTRSVGRAIYNERVHLWDSATKEVADFNTTFSFTISYTDGSVPGDGLAFFLASNGSDIPSGRTSSGGYLGLFNGSNAFNGASKNRIVAIEFDNYANDWDPFFSHIGIDLNTIQSDEPWSTIFKNRGKANACISYNASTRNLTIFMTYDGNFKFNGAWNFSLAVDLKKILPEWVDVGFSAATGVSFQAHSIHTWSFSSSNIRDDGLNTSDNGTNVGNNGLNTGVNAPTTGEGGMKKSKIGLVIGLVVASGLLLCGLCLLWFILWRKRSRERKEDDLVLDLAMQDEFESGTGPRSFTYRELASATNNFMEDRKLGEGGFGGVYKGHLSDMNLDVAVKRVKRESKQGRKEYVSEVKIISQLRHRNLVQLIGWCHEQGELLLVYELLPNGSLDSHLFGKNAILPWVTRYKIGMGLVSALFYLHEEWNQCVLHRDIKSSNVMLDSDFNAKLGDFGLARLMDHDLGMQTTMPAGTLGYLAPECVMTGKTSKESDLFSFGIVSLELACGRKPVEYKARAEDKVSLLEWVWGLYGRGKILEAADERLSMDYDEQQMERMLVMGLWCAHPDHSLRPSIRQVINVLSFESSLPILAMKMSVPVYFAPHSHSCKLSHASTSCGYTEMGVDRSGCSCSSCCSYSSKLSESSTSSSSTSLLHSQKIDI